jgi:ketosteroid isomerase-like protein
VTRSSRHGIASVSALALVVACSGVESSMTGTSRERTAQDLKAIAELHRADQRAALAGDYATPKGLWSDDPVALPPRGPIQRGRDGLERSFEQYADAAELWETVEYVQEFGEVEVLGDYAWDWGTYRGRSRHRHTGEEVSSSGKLLRILKRAPDGTWKVHRSIWSVVPDTLVGGSP